MFRKSVIALLLFVSSAALVAQTDNVFWFAAPDISSAHGDVPRNGAPINLHITAINATTVTVSQPANPAFTPVTFTLDELEHRTIRLDDLIGIDQIENYPQSLPQPPASIQKKAFKITSDPGDITVYYELDNRYNRDIFPLKGRNALGQTFYVSTQNYFPNGAYSGTAFSGFIVAATENNTRIVVYPTDDWLYFNTSPGDSIVLVLNAGETFAFRAESTAPARHIKGTLVKSDKDIVVTVYDDSMRKSRDNAGTQLSYDTFGDQIIPVGLIGHEYIVMKGQVTKTTFDGGERIFITASQPNTDIYIDGALVTTIANAGGIFNYEINNSFVHVEASKPVYINHLTGFGGELGGAVLPTIDGCTGSYSVTFTRTPNSNDAFYINLMARNDTSATSINRNKAALSFTLTSGGATTVIPSNYFEYILDSTWVLLKKTAEVNAFIAGKILPGQEARITSTISRFHLGVINGGASTGCKYGYFSDYQSGYADAGIGGANAVKQKTYCSFDPIHLVANGGISYKWTCESNPDDTVHLSSTIIADPYFSPEKGGFYKFKVWVQRECYGDTSLFMNIYVVAGPVAQFEVETATGCSPFRAVFTNLTDTSLAVQNYWNFDTRYNTTVNQSALTNPFEWSFPENLTDSVQEYTVRLTVKGDFGMCPNQKEKVIRVLPNVQAGFTADVNAGCNPLTVHFTDTTKGVLDTLNSYWDFVTYQQTYSGSAEYTFHNFSGNDTVYNVRLIAYTKFGCIDTAAYPVTVHPYINTSFIIDNLAGCSPFDAVINASGSIGVDTAKWHFRDTHETIIDSLFTRTDTNPFAFNHIDISLLSPDTIYVSLTGINNEGCADTATDKRMIIYPVVSADFEISEDEICDSVSIDITNNSTGYNLLNEWDLNDGTSFTDTTGTDFSHIFFNRTSAPKDFIITLRTVSDYFCSDTHTDTLTVFPFVDAGFSMDYTGNCSPLKVDLQNVSRGGSDFLWDFGDGDSMSSVMPGDISHTFINTGDVDTSYRIKLFVNNLYGCADSATRWVSLFPRVVAGFSFTTPDSGCNPLNVSFLNESEGAGLDYLWNFGDNTTSISQDPPARIYRNLTDNDTVYFVSLTVSNSAGCDSSVSRPVKVFSNVAADFSIERKDSCSPFSIKVINNSSGGITDFIWKYNNNDSVLLHDFSNPVIPVYQNLTLSPVKHALTLRVNNIHGCTAEKTDTVIIYPEINAVFDADTYEGCQPLLPSFINNTNIIAGTSFMWDFGDGNYSTAETPSYAFRNYSHTSDRTFTVNLTATSAYGCTGKYSDNIIVHPVPVADFTYPSATVCPPAEITFTNNSEGSGLSYSWDFGDGTVSGELNPSKIFINTGNTTVDRPISLTAITAFGCEASVTKPVGVFPGVQVDFTATGWEGCDPLEANLNGTAVNGNDYLWFVDGNLISNNKDTHFRFINATGENRVFDVMFRSVSENGCLDDTVRQVTVYPKPQAWFVADPQVQNFNTLNDLTPVNIENRTAFRNSWSFRWDFGDGATSQQSEAEFSRNYSIWGDINNENRINLSLIAENPAHPECADTMTSYIIITPPLPQVDLGNDIAGCLPLTVEFPSATKYNYPDSYEWDFGIDGLQSDDPLPGTLTYNRPGVYMVRLNVEGDGGENWDVRKITVHPTPAADFTFDPDTVWVRSQTEFGTPVKFFNTTKNGEYYIWDFGDGNTSMEFQPQHEYLQTGSYYISLIAESDEGCYDTLSHVMPVTVEGRGNLKYPNAITVYPGNPVDEHYDSSDPDPRIFRPVAEGIERYRLEIYNRWGELIFVSEDVNRGWNGYINGSPAKQDVYVWRVTGNFTNGKPFVEAGDITLLIKNY